MRKLAAIERPTQRGGRGLVVRQLTGQAVEGLEARGATVSPAIAAATSLTTAPVSVPWAICTVRPRSSAIAWARTRRGHRRDGEARHEGPGEELAEAHLLPIGTAAHAMRSRGRVGRSGERSLSRRRRARRWRSRRTRRCRRAWR